MAFICRNKQSNKMFDCLILKMKPLILFEALVTFYRGSYHYIPEGGSDSFESGNLLFYYCVYCCSPVCCGTYELQDAQNPVTKT
jgi:hypothetical protein